MSVTISPALAIQRLGGVKHYPTVTFRARGSVQVFTNVNFARSDAQRMANLQNCKVDILRCLDNSPGFPLDSVYPEKKEGTNIDIYV